MQCPKEFFVKMPKGEIDYVIDCVDSSVSYSTAMSVLRDHFGANAIILPRHQSREGDVPVGSKRLRIVEGVLGWA